MPVNYPYSLTEQHRRFYWKLMEMVNSESVPFREYVHTIHHVGECAWPFVVDNYSLVKTELEGDRIVRVESELDKVS